MVLFDAFTMSGSGMLESRARKSGEGLQFWCDMARNPARGTRARELVDLSALD